MELSDKNQFAQLLELTAQLYDKRMHQAMLQIYWHALATYHFEVVRKGFNAHIQNPDSGQFFPKPADIIRHIIGDSHTQSLGAWHKVMQGIKSAGAWSSVIFDDPIIHRVIEELGGWVLLCQTKADAMPFKQKEFQSRYRGYIGKVPPHFPRILMGIADSHNRQNGHPCTDPITLGDTQKAVCVYQQGRANGLKIARPIPIAHLITQNTVMKQRG